MELAMLMMVCALVSYAMYFVAYKGCKSSETKTHTVEVYHGNWWATWHTPGKVRLMTGSAIATMLFLTASAVSALVAG